MKGDMIDLIHRLETLAGLLYRTEHKNTLNEAVVRLVAMDAQIVKLQAKVDIYQTRASEASYAEDELRDRNERERMSGNNYGGL